MPSVVTVVWTSGCWARGCGCFERNVSNLRETTSCPVLKHTGQWLGYVRTRYIRRPDIGDSNKDKEVLCRVQNATKVVLV